MAKPNKIILVDDNDTTNFLNKTVIDRSGHDLAVEVFRDPQEALEFLESNRDNIENHLIFLDINMPVIDGWEFARQYENFDMHTRNKLVMLTSSIDPMDKSKAEQLVSINDFKSKFFSITST